MLLRKALVRPYLEYANSVWHHPYRMRLIGDPEIESHQVSHFNIPPQIQGKMVFLDDSGGNKTLRKWKHWLRGQNQGPHRS